MQVTRMLVTGRLMAPVAAGAARRLRHHGAGDEARRRDHRRALVDRRH